MQFNRRVRGERKEKPLNLRELCALCGEIQLNCVSLKE